MIDLDRTEDQMLAEIGTDGSDGTRLALRGRTPEEMLPGLMDTFSKRYASVPSERVFGELSYLVKKGLGNAYKWGNECAPERSLAVRVVMTDAGAVVAITDQGNGFDVTNVLSRFLQSDAYSRHGGSGFFHFHESGSVVSYADGGRTMLIRFLCANGAHSLKSEAPVARPPKAARKKVDLTDLAEGRQVKVKGAMTSDGRFVAEKISLKADEKWGVIDGIVRDVDHRNRAIRILNTSITLPDALEIMSPEQRRLEFDALIVGQGVELLGSYEAGRGLVPIKMQVRHDADSAFEEIQGKVQSISGADATFSVLGITVGTDGNTQIKDKRS